MTLAAAQDGAPAFAAREAGPVRAARRVPLAVKFAAAFIGLVTLVLLVNGAVNLWLSYEEAKRAALRVQQEKARAASERIDRFVSEIESQIGWTTRQEWRRIGLEQQRYDFIRLLRQAPPITELSYLDGSGREQLKVSRLEPDAIGSNADLSADPRFARAVADKLWFGPVYFRRGSEPYMTMAVAHAGRNAGVTVAEVNLKLIWDVINAIQVGEDGHAFVVNAQGKLIAHPDMSLVLRDTDLSRLPQVAAALAEPTPSRPGGAEARRASTAAIGEDLAERSVLTAYDAIPRLGWIVFVQSPLREAMAPVYTALTQTGILLALGLLLALTAGSFLARRMVGPIHQLQGGAERLGEGDLSQRIVIRTGDEIETLAERFNVMAGRIRESYETLEAKVEERTRDLNEALRQQTATADVLKVISRSAFDLQNVLDTLLASAARLCEADRGVIFRRDGDVYRWSANYGNPPELEAFAKAHPFAPGRHAVTSRVALEGQTVHVADVLADPDYGASEYQKLGGYRTILGVPLLREGMPIGVFALTRDAVRPFTEKQIELVETFADQAVIAIENARLFEEVQARTRELQQSLEYQTATSDVLNVISRSPNDLQPVLDRIVETAHDLCQATYALFFRLGPDGLYHMAAHRNADALRNLQWLRDHPIAKGDGTATGLAALEGRTVHFPDALADARFTDLKRQQQSKARTQLAVPLLRGGEVIGVIFLAHTEVRPFTDRQIELVTTFADQAVIAINNVGLFEEVQARTRELTESLQQQTATADVLKVISRSTFDLKAVLTTLVQSARELCSAPQGMVLLRDGEVYRSEMQLGYPPEFEAYILSHPILPNPNSGAGRAAFTGQVAHFADVLADPEYRLSEGQRLGGYRALLSIPLLREQEVVGVFSLGRPEPMPFTERQIELVQTFADQAVIAIENVRLFDEVQARTRELSRSLEDLQKAQDRLVQSEKLASLGQLTAGIAHEIKNPLNFVNNFSALSAELIGELRDVLGGAALDEKTSADALELMDMLTGNLEKVVQHGKRADSIVKNMLLHSREGSGERRAADVNALVEESMNLAYHGARAEKPGFNITLQKDLDPAAGEADLYPQEVTRVLLNLFSNGFYAATKRKGEMDGSFEPRMSAATRDLGDRIEIRIRDNGTGIPDEVKAKMFNPFFTTKPAGEGTGLGLSLSHDIIVKQHGGTINVATAPGEFTEFTITLPRSGFPTAPEGGS